MAIKPRTGSTALVRTLLIGLIIALVVIAACGCYDRLGNDFLEQSMKRTLVTFGLSRALNGVISVAQGTEVAVEPAGIGINFTPGEILDPVNDMIERFSWVMLSASVSLGLQQLVLELGTWRLIIVIYSVVALLAIGVLLKTSWIKTNIGWFILRLFLLFTIVRFLIPTISLLAEGLHDNFLEPRYQRAMNKLENAREQLASLNDSDLAAPKPDAEDAGVFARLRSLITEAAEGFNIGEKFDQYKKLASEVTELSIELIVIFLFQTLLLPIAVVWMGSYLFSAIIRANRNVQHKAIEV